MYVTKYTFKRGNQILILQGMCHAASPKFYKKLEKEMNQLIKQGYKVFLEGVNGIPSNLSKYKSKKEYRTARFLKIICNLADIINGFEVVGIQYEDINYPDDTINADASFKELVEALDKERSKYMPIWLIFKRFEILFTDKKIKRRLAKEMEKELMSESKKSISPSFFTKSCEIQFKIILKEFLIDFRNERAVDIIEKNSPQKALVHYGNAHIKGIKKNLEKRNWKLVKKSKIYFRFED